MVLSPNTGATNEAGFTVLPGGNREYYNGIFNNIGKNGCWWSVTEGDDATNAWYRIMLYDFSDVLSYILNKKFGFSVRCLRDN